MTLVQPRADRFRKRGHHEIEEENPNPIRSLEQTVFNLSKPHPTLTPSEDVRQTANLILEDVSHLNDLVTVFVTCLLELPHKMDIYLELLGILGQQGDKMIEFVKSILETIIQHMNSSASTGPWRHFTQSIRVCAAFVREGFLEKDNFIQLIQSLLDLCVIPTTNSTETDFILWTISASLPLVDNLIGNELNEAVKAVYQQHCREESLISKDLVNLWNCIQDASLKKEMVEPAAGFTTPISMSSPLLQAASIQVDESWDGNFEALQLFPDVFTCDPFKQWTISYWCRLLVESMELNHRRCAETLLQGIPSTLGSPEKIVAQFLFGELIRNRSNGMTDLVFETLLMDCCRLSRTFPPHMARGLQALYDNLDELGFVATDRLSSWFAHHLSNFDYKWNWASWSSVLSSPPTSMQYVFVRFSLEKLVRLSYFDRIAPTLPEEFRTLLPPEPTPHFKFEGDEEADLPIKITDLIQNRCSVDDIKKALFDEEDQQLDANQREILLQSLLQVGSKSLSHMLSVVEKYLPLFQCLIPKHTDRVYANMFILDQISSFWQKSMQHFEFAVERLVNYRILLPKSVIQWIMERSDEQLSSDMENTSFYNVIAHILGRNLILRTLQQSSMMPRVAATKMKMLNQPEEEITATVSKLQAEFEDVFEFTLEGLSLLSDRLVAPDEVTNAIGRFAKDLGKEITSLYPHGE